MLHDNVLVPSAWWLEVINGLVTGERRQRLTLGEPTRFVRILRSLPIKADEQAGIARMDDILSFSRDLGLTADDAAYLEVSLHHGLPLPSQDARMRAAAEHMGVLPLPGSPG